MRSPSFLAFSLPPLTVVWTPSQVGAGAYCDQIVIDAGRFRPECDEGVRRWGRGKKGCSPVLRFWSIIRICVLLLQCVLIVSLVCSLIHVVITFSNVESLSVIFIFVTFVHVVLTCAILMYSDKPFRSLNQRSNCSDTQTTTQTNTFISLTYSPVTNIYPTQVELKVTPKIMQTKTMIALFKPPAGSHDCTLRRTNDKQS